VRTVATLPDSAPHSILGLEVALAIGATLYGHPVRALRIETADGRIQRFELPQGPYGADESEDEFDAEPDEKELEILAVLAKAQPGEYTPGRTLSKAIDLAYKGGRFGDLIRHLKATKRIESKNPGGFRLKFQG
jgi:hypothetical protein